VATNPNRSLTPFDCGQSCVQCQVPIIAALLVFLGAPRRWLVAISAGSQSLRPCTRFPSPITTPPVTLQR
jgi:hypothetical protein